MEKAQEEMVAVAAEATTEIMVVLAAEEIEDDAFKRPRSRNRDDSAGIGDNGRPRAFGRKP